MSPAPARLQISPVLPTDLKMACPPTISAALDQPSLTPRGDTFLAVPDRGPNAVEFDDAIDNTASYVNRFHTIKMDLVPNTNGTGLPFTLTPELQKTTLLWSLTPLVYGSGSGLGRRFRRTAHQ